MAAPVRWKLKNVVCDAYEALDRHSASLHGHYHFLMTLITRGSGVQTVNGRDIAFGPGDMFLLSPADFHKNTVAAGESFDYYGVKFPYELLDSRLADLCALDRFPMHIHLSKQSAETARQIFIQLVDESQNGKDRPANRAYLQSLVEQLFIIALREIPAEETSKSQAFVNRSLGYLYSHFSENIKIEDVAAYIGYTPNYFNTCFRKQLGVSFGAYLRDVRMSYAENLLRAGKMSITEVAMESGFGTLSHFSRSFRAKYGMFPQQYKKMKQSREDEK